MNIKGEKRQEQQILDAGSNTWYAPQKSRFHDTNTTSLHAAFVCECLNLTVELC